ncbi:putative iS protein [Escherichia coli 2875150]|nr:putative iS protein [Escherichia coli 2875150]
MPGKVHAMISPSGPGAGQGKTRTARLWVYVRDDRNASSNASDGLVRVQSGPERHPSTNHLAGYSGVLQAMLTVVTGRYTNPAE